MADDSAANSGWGSSNRTLIVETAVSPGDTEDPTMTHSITPRIVVNGSQVTINVDASDNVAVDDVWAVVDYPGAGADTVPLTNDADNTYNVTLIGRHNVTIFANDTDGNTANVTDYFISAAAVSIDINVSDNGGDGVDSDVVVYEAGNSNVVASFSSSSGNFQNRVVPNGTYDLQFSAFSDDFVVLLEDVDIWDNVDRNMRLDDPAAVPGFGLTYAAETDYVFGGAIVRVYYSSGDVDDEDAIELFVCDDWVFSTRVCNDTWEDADATLDTDNNYFEADVSGFSAFSIRQDSYCGDGVCDDNEDSASCLADCACDTGDTRLCSLTRRGRCAVGSETCTGGTWSGCPQSITEVCNQQDDDCDGMTDDVGGGDSMESTACGCYNGSLPTSETFDGIDNNCNGFIDDGCVCNESSTDVCGSNIGVCEEGVKTCTNCRWGECEGDVEPFEDEICGNGLDDNCDGVIDEIADCISQTNTSCTYGPIPATGCKCGDGTHASGYCCNGVYQIEPCPDFPWWILIIIGGVILAVAAVLYFLHEKGTKGGDAWEALEKKYTPATR
jgi:hypothetical protein